MLPDRYSRHFIARRRLLALASVAALSLGVLGLAGCGSDEEPMPSMEEPAQDPNMEQGEPMGSDPSQEDTMGDAQGQEEQSGF